MNSLQLAILSAILFAVVAGGAAADVLVMANRTPNRVPIQVTLPNSRPWQVTLSSSESRPIFTDGPVEISFKSGRRAARYTLDTNAVYFLGTTKDGRVDLRKIGLGEEATAPGVLPGSASATPAATIPVKILADDEEIARRHVWEARLRKRVEAASDVLHRHAMVKLKIVAVEQWESDDAEHNFAGSLRQFERDVDPLPAELAIGFSSQYAVVRGRTHLGGTHGPLRPHILLREWSRHVSETERLELLLHELGHYLGAAHSPEPDSVMRPLLGDRQSRKNEFVVRFDPVNTLLMSMVGEEIRRRRVRHFAQLTPGTKKRLTEVYEVLGVAHPGDNSSRQLTGQLAARRVDPLTEAARLILAQLTSAARHNKQLEDGASNIVAIPLEGDDLLDAYIRLAAETATQTPEDVQAKAFLLAIGIGVGDPEELQRLPALRGQIGRIESPAERAVRNTYLGKPSIQGRHDLARHFTVAAMLVASSGEDMANTLSVAKEALDAQGGTGFSFADLAADKAGIAMASKLLAGELSLQQIAQNFRGADFVPNVADLPEGMSTMQFIDQYGGATDQRYLDVVKEIEEAIFKLPPYVPAGRQH